MISFPTTPEAFVADQERLAGRELSGGEVAARAGIKR